MTSRKVDPMVRALILMTAVLFAGWRTAGSPSRAEAAGDDPALRLLSQMTLEEKVGQMTQVTLEVVAQKRAETDRTIALDPAKLREAITKYHVGSILNCGGAANTIDNWHEILTAIQDVATRQTRLKIPVLYGIDSIHGANYVVGATIFPQSISMAATGNVELVRAASAITALETRAAGIPWNFNPVLCIGRQPLWSRLFETYGEDAYLASVLGAAYVEAQQGDDPAGPAHLAACMKHYLGYSYPRTGKDRTPAWIPERELREHFLPPFAAAARRSAHLHGQLERDQRDPGACQPPVPDRVAPRRARLSGLRGLGLGGHQEPLHAREGGRQSARRGPAGRDGRHRYVDGSLRLQLLRPPGRPGPQG